MINLHPDKAKDTTKNNSKKKDSKLNKKQKLIIIYSIVGFIVFILVLSFLLYYGPSRSAIAHALSGKDSFYEAQNSVTEENFLLAQEQLTDAEKELTLALEEIEKMGSLRAIPYVKVQISAVDNLLRAGIQTASALAKVAGLADEIITPVKQSSEFTLAQLSADQKHEILKKISESYPDLVGVKAEIDLAVAHFEQIPDKGILPQLKNAIEPIQEQLPTLKKTIAQILPAVEILPPLSGYPEEQTYLFLLENNAELRPAGGFIGTYGILKVKDGEIVSFNTDNIYNLDNTVKDQLIEEPPEPLQTYLSADKWFMRDSNWSPDFPTAAEKAIWFYHQEGGPEQNIHGVIAITPNLIESLLGLTGEIQVDGVVFTEDNFTETLQYQVEQGYYRQGISDADRKEVIGEMADQLMDRLFNFSQSRWGELWQTIENHILEKQVLFYSRNESLQMIIEQENWGGEVEEDWEGDFLFVVDANMASLKSDPGVFRTINYTLDETTDGIIADLTIKYDNTGTFDWKSTRYRTYTRVYVPEGSELLEHSGVMKNDKLHGGGSADPKVYNELGKTVFGGFISIEPKESGELHYRYKLPADIFSHEDGKSYTLKVQKQAGTNPHGLNISANFLNNILTAEPIDKIELSDNNSMTLSYDLLQDRFVEITFK